jgi:pyruvate dehydrogenase E2 component (dihydrolipoamide acetyltransferase)
MAHEIRVPRLGWSMEEGTFIRWLKKDGDTVRPGEPLFELEGEKALQEIEAVDSGTLRIAADCPAEGAVIPVGTLLGHLAEPGEKVGTQEGDSGQKTEDRGQASAAAVGWDQPAAGAGPPRASHDRAIASPRARRVAAELGVDWTRIAGTGSGGRIRERDVRQTAPAKADSSHGAALSSRRRIIAERMSASSSQTAPVTLTTRCDATNLISLRQQFKISNAIVPTYTDIVAKLTALVLRRFPHMAARWNGDQLELPAEDGLHIGIAVDCEGGLLVPVIRDVARRSLAEIAADSKRLVEHARAARLAAADMQGGIFTITNLGAFGIDAFTPIINLPEVAILGLGAIRREAVVLEDGQIAAREILTLSLTFDHRAVDGAPAARFLQALAVAISNPAAALVNA